jgi:sugar/nucleoside kinase (ribokinase family)
MPLLIDGTVAFDTVKTAEAVAENVLGGSATFCAYAARFFTEPWVVSPVGEDMPAKHLEDLRAAGINTDGIAVVPGGKTFSWAGRYTADFLERTTERTDVNVVADYAAPLPEAYRGAKHVFLANGSPQSQKATLEQLPDRTFAWLDTMNHWIVESRDALMDVLAMVDGFVLNDEEARLITEQTNLLTAARTIAKLGPRVVIIKKGEHGAIVVAEGRPFVVPAWLTETVHDPTGAGDSFGGALAGYLAKSGDTSFDALKTAVSYGTVVASFCIEDFSVRRLQRLTMDAIEARRREFAEMVSWK